VTDSDDLTRALADTLRVALDPFSQLVPDPQRLAERLAPVLSAQLAEAVGATGGSSAGLARALHRSWAAADSVEARLLTALKRHPGGRSPGVAPDSLASLTGLSPSVLGPAVSGLIQAGGLVRDAWLVRLPRPDDELPRSPAAAPEVAGAKVLEAERRAIGDRRAVGERRLYDRRTPS
jgi:hypothetical protein